MDLMFPVAGGRVTAIFDEQRPLTNPFHDHGAWDIAEIVGIPIVAPENGEVYFWCAWRKRSKTHPKPYWQEVVIKGIPFPWQNYFYDVYGGVIALRGVSGLTHIFCHVYFSQLYNKGLLPSSAWTYQEEKAKARWPIHCMHTLEHPYPVRKGEIIGYVGNAGYSTGPHVHYEIHRNWKCWDYSEREDPAQFWPEAM